MIPSSHIAHCLPAATRYIISAQYGSADLILISPIYGATLRSVFEAGLAGLTQK
jgi:hypothetical protein